MLAALSNQRGTTERKAVFYTHDSSHGSDGDVATQSIVEGPEHREADLLSVLDVASGLYGRVVEVLESLGLTYHQYRVLARLRAARGSLELDELAPGADPGCDGPPVVNDLVDRGFIRITRDHHLREPRRVAVTPLGSARAREARIQLEVIQLEFAARFRGSERAELQRLLDKVAR